MATASENIVLEIQQLRQMSAELNQRLAKLQGLVMATAVPPIPPPMWNEPPITNQEIDRIFE